jgi:hypothetical protein
LGRWNDGNSTSSGQPDTSIAPIEALQDPELGRLLYVWQCQQHNCTTQAGLFLRSTGKAVAVCISELNDKAETITDWVGQGWQTKTKGFDCGEGDEALKRLNAAKASARERPTPNR